jgi:hypothetical protein
MNALELADMAENACCAYQKEISAMLRQQQAEIEALKAHPIKDLTDEEIWKLWVKHLNDDIIVFARAILKKAQQK